MTFEELDESRPTTNEGNLILKLMVEGNYHDAQLELERIRKRMQGNAGRYQPRKRWVEWCDKAEEYVNAQRRGTTT